MTVNKENFITEKNIVIGLDAISQRDAIFKLSKILEKDGTITNSNVFAKDVLKRESLATTGIGNGIAIPHGKSEAVRDASMIFAKVLKPLEWNSLDGSKVDVIFLMAVRPQGGDKEHLKMLANLSGRLMDDDFLNFIKKENDPKKLVSSFNKEEV
ncbi:PTS sugar transporter subunit IIA [Alkalibaculum bacchi]|jgi:PTS system fructose-specific IIA component|uniref:PTS sugar transporter subunit IIA n=1 Tax=Alkalibaculum bacchi TaxID=645887 RepID=UPI0026EFFDFB|nr:fructose PTS transporter subunit IIA [Alkalibaculum bacchi]